MQKGLLKWYTDRRGETGPPSKMKLLFQPVNNWKQITISGKYTWVRLTQCAYDYAQSALLSKFWIVASIPAKVNGFEITSSTAVLSLE
jgi:hypothetical protein